MSNGELHCKDTQKRNEQVNVSGQERGKNRKGRVQRG